MQGLEEAESRDAGEVWPNPPIPETLLLPQVPTPITEMEISVKRVRAAAIPPSFSL